MHAVKQTAEEIIRGWIQKYKPRVYPVTFQVKDYNPVTRVLTLRKKGDDPTDNGCWLEASLYLELCALEDQTVKVFVTGVEPLSLENPLDYEWACQLESCHGKPVPLPKDYQKNRRVKKKFRSVNRKREGKFLKASLVAIFLFLIWSSGSSFIYDYVTVNISTDWWVFAIPIAVIWIIYIVIIELVTRKLVRGTIKYNPNGK